MRVIISRTNILVQFNDEYEADKYAWLFRTIFRMRHACVGGYFNGYSFR